MDKNKLMRISNKFTGKDLDDIIISREQALNEKLRHLETHAELYGPAAHARIGEMRLELKTLYQKRGKSGKKIKIEPTSSSNQLSLKNTFKQICNLQPSYDSTNTPEMQERGNLIRNVLVEEIRSRRNFLAPALGPYESEFLVSASDGIGRKTEAPWVRFCAESMSPRPTDGYYVVIHFRRDGTAMFLTLGCGSTTYTNGSFIRLDQSDLLKKTQAARDAIESAGYSIDDFSDKIELGASALLPRQFELATAIARRIEFSEIDNTDFDALLTKLANFLQPVYAAQSVGFDVTHADQAELEIESVIKPRRTRGSQGFGLTAPEKKVVELRAMDVTRDWFETRGYDLDDTSASNPYDFLATKGSVETKVEVKGTTSFDPTKLSMTWREVELHQKEKGSTALSIVSSIKLQRGDPPTASEGKIEVLLGWDIDEWSLKPVSYSVERKN